MPTASVCPPPSSATWTTTVRTARMRLPVKNPPAAVTPSSATTRRVSQPSGAAMATTTAPTGPTSGRRIAMDARPSRPLVAAPTSSGVLMGSASTAAGGATEARTARIAQTKSTAVSYPSFFFLFFFPVLHCCRYGQFKSVLNQPVKSVLSQLCLSGNKICQMGKYSDARLLRCSAADPLPVGSKPHQTKNSF